MSTALKVANNGLEDSPLKGMFERCSTNLLDTMQTLEIEETESHITIRCLKMNSGEDTGKSNLWDHYSFRCTQRRYIL